MAEISRNPKISSESPSRQTECTEHAFISFRQCRGKVRASVRVEGAWPQLPSTRFFRRVSIVNLCGGCLCLGSVEVVRVVKQRYLRRDGLTDDDRD
jgi:hypothetical protein